MVNPTGHPPAGSANSLHLQAVNGETQRYLGQQVGKVIEARVIQVLTQLPVAAGGSTSAGGSASAGSPTSAGSANNTGSASSTAAANNTAGIGGAASGKAAVNPAERYQLLLSIDNQRSIKVEASLAPRIGQLLQLAVIDNQQLRIVSPGSPANANATAQSNAGPNTVAGLASAANLKPGELAPALKPTPAPSAQNTTGSGDTARKPVAAGQAGAVLGQALRDALPRQTAREGLLAALAQLATAAASPPGIRAGATPHLTSPAATPNPAGNPTPLASTNASAAQASAVTGQAPIAAASALQIPAIQTAAQQLANAIPQAAALGDPVLLRAALLNSGVFYEHKLAGFAAQQRTLQNALQTAGSSSAESATRQATAPLTLDERARIKLGAQLQGDIKGHVLTLASALKAALPVQTLASLQPTATTPGGDPRGETALANLWQVLNTAHGSTNQPANTQLDPVLQLLRLALGNSARIQAQQLLAVGSQFASQGDPQINQSLNLELPLWLDQRLAMVEVRVDREKSSRKTANKIETWNVRLRFDLEELGELTALATLQGKRMAAVLWASAAGLTEKIQQELAAVAKQLDELGLEVQHLQCRTGPAPEASAHSAVNVLQMNLLDTQS